jgi:hypothetical protein
MHGAKTVPRGHRWKDNLHPQDAHLIVRINVQDA